MTRFCAVISCERDASINERLMNTLAREDVESVFLFKGAEPRRYEVSTNIAGVGNAVCFYNSDSAEGLSKFEAYLKGSSADIVFFLNSGEVVDGGYLEYLESFFSVNRDRCGVVFAPVVAGADRHLPREFEDLPKGGLFEFDEGFPKNLDGAAVLIDDARSARIDMSSGGNALLDMLERVEKSKNAYARLNKVVIEKLGKKPMIFSHTTRTKYLVSCIIPIYNVEQYLQEAIESVVNQTIGFEENVQLILVNDGSADSSEEICRVYLGKYPKNIVYIKQENQGVSAARNAGLDVVKGEFVTFLDGDDIYDTKFFYAGIHFIREYWDDIDFVAIPIQLFEAKIHEHPLNYKHKADKVVDLSKDYNYPQGNLVSTLIKQEAIKILRLDNSLKYCEDGEYIHRIVLNKMKYGIMKEPFYYARKRDNGGSATNLALLSSDWYNRIIDYGEKLVEQSQSIYGKITEYSQFLLLNELAWSNVSEITEEVKINFSFERLERFLTGLLRIIDASVIMGTRLNYWLKAYLLKLKYGHVYIKEDNFYTGDKCFEKIHPILNVSIIEEKNGVLRIEGVYNVIDSSLLKLIAVYNNNVYEPVISENDNYSLYFFGKKIHSSILFSFQIPYFSDGYIEFYMELYNGDRAHVKFSFSAHAKMRNKTGSFIIGDKTIAFLTDTNKITICDLRLDTLITSINSYISKNFTDNTYSEDIILLTEYIKMYPVISKKHIWLFCDRRGTADDNAEALFKYYTNITDGIERYFIIEENSPDFVRLHKFGKVIPFGSKQHKLLYLFAEKVISSHTAIPDSVPFSNNKWDIYFGLMKFDFIFLQHGVIKDDMSAWLIKLKQNIKLFITSSKYEYESIIHGNYGYSSNEVVLTGLPRFDTLLNNREKYILFMPTWRGWISRSLDYDVTFAKTNFCKWINNVLTGNGWLDNAREYGYYVVFKPHPRLLTQMKDFIIDERILVSTHESYQQLFSLGALLITDYSSAAFDFAYLRKPVIYSHVIEGNLKPGYFDYERDGFGEVTYTIDELAGVIRRYIDNDCCLLDKYRKRIDDTFAYVDRFNCKRVFEAIIKGR